MSLTETMQVTADAVGAELEAMRERYEAGDITKAEFTVAGQAILLRAVSAGVALGDVALAATLTLDSGEIVTPTGILPPESAPDEVARGLRDLLAAGAIAGAGAVLGRATSMDAIQTSYHQAMRARSVEYWTREADADACQMCLDLCGPVLPVDVEMFHHKGCGCTPRPVTRGGEEK